MRHFRIKIFISIFFIIFLFSFSYYYREDISHFLQGTISQEQPCQRPITYSIANVDPRFGLTKEELLSNIERAERIWEPPINRQLFEYSSIGELKINLIYDYRQEATDALRKIGIVISNNQSTYDALKVKYDLLVTSYNKGKAQIDELISIYNADKRAYEKDVNYWNSHGGAVKAERNILEQERTNLNNQIIIINQAEYSLNGLVDTINSAAIVLNKLIASLNLQVDTYNTVGLATGKEFKEGEYVSDANGITINIFQFNDIDQLVKVLAHEFGHALGIEHINNPKAIMYYLNEGINENLTIDDLTALRNACGIK